MPELPEVETVRRILEKQLYNKEIKDVIIHYDGILENVDSNTFKKELHNEVFKEFKRRGKYLILILKKHTLIVHLRMEGKFYIKELDAELSKHEHIEFILKDKVLRYHDTRKFGRFVLLNTTNMDEILAYKSLKDLGVEVQNNEDYQSVIKKIKTLNIPIKKALLDQSLILGIGNIYADEICFKSSVNPLTKCRMLSDEQLESIVKNTKLILNDAIMQGGTTIRSYTSSLGVTGLFQQNLYVHKRENEPCKICNTLIKKIFVGGRGTYFCPKCQKTPKSSLVIGLTGVIGSGKTMVSKYLESIGYKIIDCDVINREILMQDSIYYGIIIKKIEKEFPMAIVNNTIDRKALRNIIFSDSTKKQKLEKIIYPIIKKEVEIRLYKLQNQVVILSAPLLFESGFDKYCDLFMIIESSFEILINRIIKRDNVSYNDAKNALRLRDDFFKRIKLIDEDLIYIVKNNASLDELKNEVNKVMKRILEE